MTRVGPTGTWTIARDRKRKRVLLGGVGFAGDGRMWVREFPQLNEERAPGYDDAPDDGSLRDDFGWTSRQART